MEGTAGWVGAAAGRRARDVVATADVEAFVSNIRFRQERARYPELFAATTHEPAVPSKCELVAGKTAAAPSSLVFHRERTVEGGSGLVVTALRHAELNSLQRQALGTFRLEQCVLCGWYDPAAVRDGGFGCDPACEALADDAIHLVVGTRDGTILSYFCLEPASLGRAEGQGNPITRDGRGSAPGRVAAEERIAEGSWTVADRQRPLFATERDLFGPGVFATLSGLASAPIARIREVNYLMRNQAVAVTSRLVSLAVVEAISGVGQLLFTFSSPLVALVGNMDREARRLLHDLDVPVLYAPHAPVMAGDQLCPWSAAVDTLGRFWPFVIAADDLQVIYRDYVMWLDTVLGLPVSQAVLALVRKRRGPKEQPPVMFTSTREVQGTRTGPGSQRVCEGTANGTSSDPMSGAAGQEWTADPGCDTRTPAPMSAGEPARVAAVRSGLAAR